MTLALLTQRICEKNHLKLLVHNCSMCDYPCGYIFNDGLIYYDCGCNCPGAQCFSVELRPFEEFSKYIEKLTIEEINVLVEFIMKPESVVHVLDLNSLVKCLAYTSKASPLEINK